MTPAERLNVAQTSKLGFDSMARNFFDPFCTYIRSMADQINGRLSSRLISDKLLEIANLLEEIDKKNKRSLSYLTMATHSDAIYQLAELSKAEVKNSRIISSGCIFII